jgi:hypothetical protein
MKDFIEDKFIVINKERFEELNIALSTASIKKPPFDCGIVHDFKTAVESFVSAFECITGKELNHKYLVCNKDEPYAPFVKALILDGFVTPGQYEEAAGKKYPAKAPVWYAETNRVWRLRPYGEALQDWMRRDLDSLPARIVCAIGDRIPEDGSLPGCCGKQWFEGD